MWTYVILAILIALLVKWYRSLFIGFEKIDDMFPGPATVPVLGNLLDFYGPPTYLYDRCIKFCMTYRRSFRLWLANRLYILLMTPAEVEALLNNTVHLTKSELYDTMIPWVGRGLLTSYGGKWKKNRKLLTPAFHFKILESFLDVFNANSKVLCEKLEEQVGKSQFNIMELVKLCALDNICETSMGVKVNSQLNPDSELTRAIKRMCYLLFLFTMRPWLRIEPIFSLTKIGREHKRLLNVIHSFTRKVVEKKIQNRKNRNANNTDDEQDEIGAKKKQVFLDLLLDCYDEGHLTREELHDEVDTFMFEGHDTITSGLSFCLYNLATHQQYQDRAYDEIHQIFGDDDRPCTSEDVANMKYLEMVIKESLRLHPSVAFFGRLIEQDLRLDSNTVIPKGAQALIVTPAMHANPDIWERPEEFYPDHFLPEVSAARHPFSYIPFSAGPRNCIGMKFAMLEMKSTLSHVLRNFKILPSNPFIKVMLTSEVTLQSASGVPVSVVRRNKN